MCSSSLHTCKVHKRWGLSATRAPATGRLPGSKVGGAAERLRLRLSLRSPTPALARRGGGHAGSCHRVLAEAGKSWVEWPRPSLFLPRPPVRPVSRAFSGGQTPGEGGVKGPGLLTHHLQPLSRARSKSQDFRLGHCQRGRGDSTWGTPALPRAVPQRLRVSEAARGRIMEPQSALSCPGSGSGAPFQNNPPGSSLNAGPVVASEESRLGPDFLLLASLSRCTAPSPRRIGSLFPSRPRGTGHHGTCSLRRSTEPVGGGELKAPMN